MNKYSHLMSRELLREYHAMAFRAGALAAMGVKHTPSPDDVAVFDETMARLEFAQKSANKANGIG